jgi:conjugal transfer/entry exclusion protein
MITENEHKLMNRIRILMDEKNDLIDEVNKLGESLQDAVKIILDQKADLEIAKEIVEKYQSYFENKKQAKKVLQ